MTKKSPSNSWPSAQWLWWLIGAAFLIGLLTIFPPFYLANPEEENEKLQAKTFNPSLVAAQIWENELAASLAHAFDAGEVLNAIRQDRQAAKNRYAKVVGLGGPHHYLLKGTGRITAIRDRQVEISLDDGSSEPQIILKTSMIFGNEILDATQVVSRSRFQRTNDYNAVGAELNKMVETQVIQPFLKQAVRNDLVRFVGCSSKIVDDDPIPIPMYLVPLKLEVLQNESQ